MFKSFLVGVAEFAAYIALTAVLVVFALAYFDVLCYDGGMSCLKLF